MSDDEYEQAERLILRGSRGAPKRSESLENVLERVAENQLIDDYWLEFARSDLEYQFYAFEFSEDHEERQKAAKLLVAYFLWCRRNAFENGPGGKQISDYILRFADLIFLRLAGLYSESELDDDRGIPRWVTPNAALGWDKPPNRPRKDTSDRDLAIAANVELLRRTGVDGESRKEQTASKFCVGVATVEKVWTHYNSDQMKSNFGFDKKTGNRFTYFDEETLKAIIEGETDRQ